MQRKKKETNWHLKILVRQTFSFEYEPEKKISFQVFSFADVDLRDETSKLYVSTQIMANADRSTRKKT